MKCCSGSFCHFMRLLLLPAFRIAHSLQRACFQPAAADRHALLHWICMRAQQRCRITDTPSAIWPCWRAMLNIMALRARTSPLMAGWPGWPPRAAVSESHWFHTRQGIPHRRVSCMNCCRMWRLSLQHISQQRRAFFTAPRRPRMGKLHHSRHALSSCPIRRGRRHPCCPWTR